jgi:hypothetical protein
MKFKRHLIMLGYLAVIAYLIAITGCTSKETFYTGEDFYHLEKIDAHVHINHNTPVFTDEARRVNFRLLTVNVDYPDFPPVRDQEKIALAAIQSEPDVVAFAATFKMTGWNEPGWRSHVIRHLDSLLDAGAVAVKVWKNIGMDFRDSRGELIMIDNPGFDSIFAHITSKHIPLIGHLGEPKSCWQPVDQIPIKYIREYFTDHPQYHMYLHPEMPSYEEQMRARDNMLEKNKSIEFVGAHLASLEWSVDELGRFLDRFHHADVDMAARMGNIQYQSSRDREKVRQFFINYQDRILYGTDLVHTADVAPEEFLAEIRKIWQDDWVYLTSDSLLTNNEFDGSFHGLHLPALVINKIYAQNAQRKFSGAWKKR